MKSDTPQYVSLQHVANFYSLDVKTIRRWAREGKLPVVQVGSRIRVHVTDMHALREQ